MMIHQGRPRSSLLELSFVSAHTSSDQIIEDERPVEAGLRQTESFPPEPISEDYHVEAAPEAPVDGWGSANGRGSLNGWGSAHGWGSVATPLATISKKKKKGKKGTLVEPPPLPSEPEPDFGF